MTDPDMVPSMKGKRFGNTHKSIYAMVDKFQCLDLRGGLSTTET